jgi:cob(I)alamin adenosyltransferase
MGTVKILRQALRDLASLESILPLPQPGPLSVPFSRELTMSSIATKSGDLGKTGLAGGIRLSKADLRVEAYGTVDELNSSLGLARACCSQPDINDWTETIQRTLFRVGAALSTPSDGLSSTQTVTETDVEFLTTLVYQIESTDGILSDWSLPGANRESAFFEVARTICRRAERDAVRFNDTGSPDAPAGSVPPAAISYLNRLSDLIWLFGRLIEVRAGIDARLRTDAESGPNFSRAW